MVCVDGMMAAVSLFPSPVPNDEAVSNAKTNYRWRGAVQVAEQHKAHVFIAVMSGDKPLTDAGILLVRLCAAALAQETATGIYTAGTVFEPDFYRAYAAFYFENDLYPVMNLVFFGLYSRDNGDTWCSYTYGMKNTFLKDEFEVFDTKHTPEELIEFMSDVASYVIEEDATLLPGQTIGFTEEQKLAITKSPSDVLAALSGYIGGSYASNFVRFTKLYRVMVQASPEYRLDTESLNNIFVRTNSGEMSPIGQYLKLTRIYGSETLSRFNLFPSIQVGGTAADGYSSGQAIQAIRETAAEVLPEGYGYEFGGMSREEASAQNTTALVFVICIVFIYLILCGLSDGTHHAHRPAFEDGHPADGVRLRAPPTGHGHHRGRP